MTPPRKRPDGLYDIPANINAVEAYDNIHSDRASTSDVTLDDNYKRSVMFRLWNKLLLEERGPADKANDSAADAALLGLSKALGVSYSHEVTTQHLNVTRLRNTINAAIERGDF